MKAFVEIVIGLIFIVIGILLLTYQSWFKSFVVIVQGGIILVIFLLGLGVLLLGLSELKE